MSQAILEILKTFRTYKVEEAEAKRLLKPGWYIDLRVKYDPDAKYYHEVENLDPLEAVRGDVITSFWTPYVTLLKREAGVSVKEKTIDELNLLILRITSPSEKIKAVNDRIERFAELYYTKGNFMLLPVRNSKESMNVKRFYATQDRIDWTLRECFQPGKLSGFFNDDDKAVKQWIDDQNLTSVFVNKEVGKDNIDWFIPGTEPKKITRMSTKEIYTYLDRAVQLIEHRNQ